MTIVTASLRARTMGPAAKGMVDSGAAHFVSREEMLGLLDEADRDGLVLQPDPSQ